MSGAGSVWRRPGRWPRRFANPSNRPATRTPTAATSATTTKATGPRLSGSLPPTKRKRLDLYRMVAAFVRAYANLANEMLEAGYTEPERLTIRE